MTEKSFVEYQRLRNIVEEVLQSWNVTELEGRGLVTRQAMAEMILDEIRDELK